MASADSVVQKSYSRFSVELTLLSSLEAGFPVNASRNTSFDDLKGLVGHCEPNHTMIG